MIKINHLSKIYQSGTDVAALNDINLLVNEGDIFGIIGMSGAGKSTLLRCVSFLEEATAGSIEVDGRDMALLKGRELMDLRKQIGVIFQGYHLLMQRTVSRNIAFPLELAKLPKEEIDKRVSELLSLVGLTDKAQAYPAQLSGGQQQRVAIARALATRPKVLLCDEPTSALDPLTTRSILNLVKDINRKLGVTIVIITHEILVVRTVCNRMAVIDNGYIVEDGKTTDILEAPKNAITRLLLGKID